MDLIKTNIQNLINLWRIGGIKAGQFIEEPNYRISIGPSNTWPNKLWFTNQPSIETLQAVKLKINLNQISIPIWGTDIKEQEKTLIISGFEARLSQIGMSKLLNNEYNPTSLVQVQKVTNDHLAKVWSKLFHEAFAYELSPITVNKTKKSVDYYIAKSKGVPIGTAALFIDINGNAGIHSMGIIPSQRRKGYAEQLLNHLLSKAQLAGANYVTLQASQMGKGLYLKTGFQENFTMKTFTYNN